MTLDELKALNPGRDDLESDVVGDITIVKYRGTPPRMVMLECEADVVPGELWRRVKSENELLNRRHAALCAEVTALKDTIVRLTMGGASA